MCPDLNQLLVRVCAWRDELGQNKRPDTERLAEALQELQNHGLDRDFVIFTVVLCEWWFRVLLPSPDQVKRALTKKLSTEGYTPYNIRFSEPVRTPRVPQILDCYLDACLQKKWNARASEQSRWLLRGRIADLTREFARPFRIANFQLIPPRKHGQPWQACWAASAIVYERLRADYKKRTDSRPLDGALTLAGALLGRTVDDAQFRRNRRRVLSEQPDLAQAFTSQFSSSKTSESWNIQHMLEPDYPWHTVISLL